MRAGKPSATAIGAATFRAAHLLLFPGTPIHADTFALPLTGLPDREALRSSIERFDSPALPRICAYFALRHRFSEDRLRAALARGAKQVVLLGAGLDSFALRHPELVRQVSFVEIDHPDSQSWKLERLRALGLETPGVRYVPLDFARQELASELIAVGIERGRPTFFAWLGVSQYVSERAALETLALVAAHAAGSEVVFDVILPFEGLAREERAISRAAERASSGRGEPWLSYFEPESFARRLRAVGFDRVDRLAPAAAAAYYAGQPPEVTPLYAWQLMAAVVEAR
jgi:methyltransferase (TIGR00027 family)